MRCWQLWELLTRPMCVIVGRKVKAQHSDREGSTRGGQQRRALATSGCAMSNTRSKLRTSALLLRCGELLGQRDGLHRG